MSKKIADILAEVVEKSNSKKKPKSSGVTKVVTLRPPNITKIKDDNE